MGQQVLENVANMGVEKVGSMLGSAAGAMVGGNMGRWVYAHDTVMQCARQRHVTK